MIKHLLELKKALVGSINLLALNICTNEINSDLEKQMQAQDTYPYNMRIVHNT